MKEPVLPQKPKCPKKPNFSFRFVRKYIDVDLLEHGKYDEEDNWVAATPDQEGKRGFERVQKAPKSLADIEKFLPPGVDKKDVFLDLDVSYSDYYGQYTFKSLKFYYDVEKTSPEVKEKNDILTQTYQEQLAAYEIAMKNYEEDMASFAERRKEYEVFMLEARMKKDAETLNRLKK